MAHIKKIKLAIADDHKLFRKGLIAILSTYPVLQSIIEAENGKDLLDKINGNEPDVILLDLNMPVLTGWNVMQELKKRKSEINIIIISMYEEDNIILNAINNGARGFLSKNADPEEIVLAIQSVVQTGYYFNDQTNKALLKKLVADKVITPILPATFVELSDRDRDILQMIATEKSTAEIAVKINLSVSSIEAIRRNLMEKFGAKNSVGLVLHAAKLGFIQL